MGVRITTDLVINENPDKKKWDDFVFNHPSGNIFQTSLMHDVYKNTPNNNAGVIALEDGSKKIVGVLVYTIIFEPGIKTFFSTRSIINGGPVVSDNNHEYAQKILNYYNQKIRTSKAIYTEVRNLCDVQAINEPFLKCGFAYVPHMTIHNDLTLPVEEMKKALHRGRASNIKRALNKGIVIRELTKNDEIALGHKLIAETYERINLPAPHPSLFLNTSEILKDKCRIVGAFVEDKLVGCRVYLIYKELMYDWFAAIDMKYSNYQVADLLPWHNMLWGKENGIKIYDFAGAGNPNKEYTVRDYKLKFGGKLLTFGRYSKIHKPVLYNVGKIGLKFYKYIR